MKEIRTPFGGILELYPCEAETARETVLICPGGGYSFLAPREAEPIAGAFGKAGYHAAVLKYCLEKEVLGTDPVQLDAYGCRLMGLELEQVPYIGLAEGWGAGSAHIAPEDVVRLNQPTAAAEYPAPSGKVAALTRNVQAKSACSACYASLVRALYNSRPVREPIAIGQGWKGVAFDGLGIGACCSCASRQVPGCPPTAEAILAQLERE